MITLTHYEDETIKYYLDPLAILMIEEKTATEKKTILINPNEIKPYTKVMISNGSGNYAMNVREKASEIIDLIGPYQTPWGSLVETTD